MLVEHRRKPCWWNTEENHAGGTHDDYADGMEGDHAGGREDDHGEEI